MNVASLTGVLRVRAAHDPDGVAYTFLSAADAGGCSITWSQLEARAAAWGAALRDTGASAAPVLLALHSGREFIEALFGCWYAGAIPVPVSLPHHRQQQHRLHGIITDCGARFAIGTAATREQFIAAEQHAADVTPRWLDVHAVQPCARAEAPTDTPIALLQYTSGSTGTPRGVVVTHANLIHNSTLIAEACAHQPGEVIAGWLPLFHDMGLVGLVVQALTAGVRCVLMPPERFLMRPWLWLQMISDYRACSSPAPNFAYQLCVERVGPERRTGLDLSCWRNALNGSERVRADTLERFAQTFADCGFNRRAFFPCYGLAEATLLVTAPAAPRELIVNGGYVGCGRPAADTELVIINPDSCSRVAAGDSGEIWVRGSSVAAGYWNNPEATAATFHAAIEADTRAGGWLRTGDLGYLDASGELFITGRLRELIILAGRNHFPADLELTVESADAAIAASGVAAFAVELDGAERLIIAAEIRRTAIVRHGPDAVALDIKALRNRIRTALGAAHDVAAFDIALLRPGALPRTTSGKIRRLATGEAYVDGTLEVLETEPDALIHC